MYFMWNDRSSEAFTATLGRLYFSVIHLPVEKTSQGSAQLFFCLILHCWALLYALKCNHPSVCSSTFKTYNLVILQHYFCLPLQLFEPNYANLHLKILFHKLVPFASAFLKAYSLHPCYFWTEAVFLVIALCVHAWVQFLQRLKVVLKPVTGHHKSIKIQITPTAMIFPLKPRVTKTS